MRLLRPLGSHRLAPSPLRSFVRVAEASLLWVAWRVVRTFLGVAVLRDTSTTWQRELRFAVFLVACMLAGGAVYAAAQALFPRRGVALAGWVRVRLAAGAGALVGGLVTLEYWRRTPGREDFSHLGVIVFGMVCGVTIALILYGLAAWQDRTDATKHGVRSDAESDRQGTRAPTP